MTISYKLTLIFCKFFYILVICLDFFIILEECDMKKNFELINEGKYETSA
jgi:hypothetical protein